MKKLIILLLIALNYPSYSSNLLGGEITCKNTNGLTYKTTLTIYRDGSLFNIPSSLTITYRDSLDTIVATHTVITPNYSLGLNGVRSYKYLDNIIFPANGTYKISARESYRDSVLNITNASSYGMYLECMIMADGSNSSPEFLGRPINIAQLNQPFINNITPYDANRDSMSWELVIPEDLVSNGSGGFNIVSLPYNYPPADSSFPFHIDSILGDISFKPNLAGKYQIAVKLIEWRNGVQIGYVKRDMELKIIPNSGIPIQAYCQMYVAFPYSLWYQGTPTPTWYLTVPQLLTLHFMSMDTITHFDPSINLYGSALINTSASSFDFGGNDYYDSYFYFPSSSATVSNNPYFITFRVNKANTFYIDYTFRIFVSPQFTGINEISNDTKSVYLKSIDLLGRETDPNLPGFRIDLYSDGKTKKVFRGE
jgi:hypothetical protein